MEPKNFLSLSGEGQHIAIIDSGVDKKHKDFCKADISALCVVKENGLWNCSEQESTDQYGHGTACTWSVHKKAPAVRITSLQILNEQGVADFDRLKFALEWCIERSIPIISLSLGSVSKSTFSYFEKIGILAKEKEIFIFVAKNDDGLSSIPADIPNFIGVTRMFNGKRNEFTWDEISQTAGAYGSKQRVGWPNPPFYALLEGSSFATAHMSALFSLIRQAHPNKSYSEYIELLSRYCVSDNALRIKKVHGHISTNSHNSEKFLIKNATIWGYTKEMHVLLKYPELSGIHICTIVDHLRSGHIGQGIMHENSELLVQNYEKVNKLGSDTLIISRLSKLEEMISVDLLKLAIEYGISHRQNIYSLEYVDYEMYPELFKKAHELRLKIRHPMIEEEDLSHAKNIREVYGHMGDTVPIVGIFGTGTSQGKFTLQLLLRAAFMRLGYSVKSIGTEMHCELFGFESHYPMEILKSIKFSQWDMIEYLQGEIRRLEIEAPVPEIIFVGSQSGTIPKTFAVKSSIYTLPSISFLFGTIPHAYILVVNHEDDQQYIRDTITALEVLGKGKVICLVYSNLIKKGAESFLLDAEGLNFYQELLHNATGLPATNVGTKEGLEELINVITKYFSN